MITKYVSKNPFRASKLSRSMGKLIWKLLKGFDHPFLCLLNIPWALPCSLKFGPHEKIKKKSVCPNLFYLLTNAVSANGTEKMTCGSPQKQFLHNVWKTWLALALYEKKKSTQTRGSSRKENPVCHNLNSNENLILLISFLTYKLGEIRLNSYLSGCKAKNAAASE